MRKILILIGSFLLLLVAVSCGGNGETAVPAPAQPESATESDAQSVAAKPQLIEFYADW